MLETVHMIIHLFLTAFLAYLCWVESSLAMTHFALELVLRLVRFHMIVG